jgi:hypothetical protein
MPGTYHIVVYAQGADGTSVSSETSSVTVSQMPGGIAGTPPSLSPSPFPPSDVQVSLYGQYQFFATAGPNTGTQIVAGLSGSLHFGSESRLIHASVDAIDVEAVVS